MPEKSDPEAAFKQYKETEKLAFRIVGELQDSGARKEDIEIALVTAIFELHKGTLLPHTVGKIVLGHVENLIPYYPKPQSVPPTQGGAN